MKTVIVAFDIDGTLRCNCTDICRDTNPDVMLVARLLSEMKNTRLIAWSGGGQIYTSDFIHSNPQLVALFKDRCYSKLNCPFKPDLAFDDQHEFSLGEINLIVRAK